MNRARYGVSEFCFFVADAVTADDRAARLNHLRQATGKDALQDFQVCFVGKTYQGEGSQRPSSHGIHVAQGVRGRDLTEGVRIVHDRGKEIDGLDEGTLRRELVHAGIIRRLKPDQHAVIRDARQRGEDLVQYLWTEFGRSTRRFDVRG